MIKLRQSNAAKRKWQKPFDLDEYVKKETEASGVPFYVIDPEALRDGAKLVRSVLESKRET